MRIQNSIRSLYVAILIASYSLTSNAASISGPLAATLSASGSTQLISDYCDVYLNAPCDPAQFTQYFYTQAESGDLPSGNWYNLSLYHGMVALYDVSRNSNGSISIVQLPVDQGTL